MSVKVINREYRNQFYQPSETTDWLLGNTGDWQQLTLRFEARIEYKATDQQSVTIDFPNKTFKLNNNAQWSDYGFDIGDTVIFTLTFIQNDATTGNPTSSNDYTFTFLIGNLFGNTLEWVGGFFASFLENASILPSNRGVSQITNVKFQSAKEPEGIKFRYSLLTNDDFDTQNLSSFLDQSVTEFSFAGLNSSPIGQVNQLNPDGFQSGMAIKGGTVTKVAVTGFVYTYEVTIDFLINSLFEDPTNLELPLTPPSQLFNAASLTDNFEIFLYPEWNNPNTLISNILENTARLGNTGWLDENFNGLDNNFVVESVAYEDDDGNPRNGLDYFSPTIVTIRVSGVANLTAQSRFITGFAYIPADESNYFNNENPYQDNLFILTGREYSDGLNDSFGLDETNTGESYDGNGLDGAFMTLEPVDTSFFTGDGADEVLFKGRYIPNPSFAALFDAKVETDRNYLLWISVADSQPVINFSDRVSLYVDYGALLKTITPAGAYPGMTNKFIEHPQEFNVLGVDKYFGFLKDDILCRVLFDVEIASGDFITGMNFGFEVKDIATGATQTLQEYQVNLSNFFFDSNGRQDIDFDAIRGFKLETGNNKNWVKVLNNTPLDDDDTAAFVAYFAAKIRWEDWIARDGVSDLYFNTALPNNGLNNDWIDYLRAGDTDSKEFNFVVFTNVLGTDGETLVYKNEFPLTFNDYDENANIVTTHEYYRDSDNTLLNIGTDPETGRPLGVLLNDEPTRIEITFENLTEDWDFAFMYGVMTLEVRNGAGQFEMRQLSSVWGSEADNPLVPVSGETKLKFELLAPRIIKISALVDPTLLEEAEAFEISGRIGCWAESPGDPTPPGIYQPVYSTTYE